MSETIAPERRVPSPVQETPQSESRLAQLPVTIIEPSRGWISLKLKELIEYRDLLFLLAWRDVSVRYKQTVLGAAWAVI